MDLTSLRSKFSRLRNQARRFRRLGQRRLSIEKDAQLAKYDYQKVVTQAKKSHWEAFLDDTENIWQAAKYLGEGGSGFASISRLKQDNNEVEAQDETEIAATLLSSFFPPLPPYPAPQYSNSGPQISMPPLTEEDVRNAIFSASSFSAGGIDGLPSVVWQKLWTILKCNVVTRDQLTGPRSSRFDAEQYPNA